MKSHRPRRKFTKRQQGLLAAAILIAVVLMFAGLYYIGSRLENNGVVEPSGNLEARRTNAPTVMYRNAAYHPRTGITTVLFIGVDRNGGESVIRDSGQADFLLLLVIDEDAQRITPMLIDRDTMAEMTVTNVLGKRSGTRTQQICLSHGFGNTPAEGCDLTVSAVSTFLLSTPIDYYISLNMDGIRVLNDAIGGVSVTLTDDFSALDPSMQPGVTLTLRGEQAEYYVRNRYGIADSSNRARSLRQQDYLSKFAAELDAHIRDDANFVGTLLDALDAYITTDMKRGKIINVAWNSRLYTRMDMRRPTGEYVRGSDGFMEFHADESDVESLVIDLFYQSADTDSFLKNEKLGGK